MTWYKTLGKCSRFCIDAAVGLIVALAIIVGIVGWQAYHGGFNTAFLGKYLERTLVGENSPLSLEVEKVNLVWSHTLNTLMIESGNIRLIDEAGEPAVDIKKVSIQLSRRGLLTARFLPVHITIQSPRLRLKRSDAGKFGLTQQEVEELPPLSAPNKLHNSALVAQVIATPIYFLKKGQSLQYFESLKISDIQVIVAGEKADHTWYIENSNVDFYKSNHILAGQFAFDIHLDDTLTQLDGEANYNLIEDELDFVVKFKDLTTAQLISLQPAFFKKIPLDSSFSGAVTSTFSLTDGVRGPDISLDRIGFKMTSGAGTFFFKNLYKEPIPYKNIDVSGKFTLADQTLFIEKAHLDMGAYYFDVTASLTADKKYSLQAQVSELTLEQLMPVWPKQVMWKTRWWVSDNFKKGLFKASFSATGTIEKDDILTDEARANLSFHDLTTTYFRTFPPVEDVKGTSIFTADTMETVYESGHIGDLKMTAGKSMFTDLRTEAPKADIEMTLEGPVASFIKAADRDPVDLSKNYDYNFKNLNGDARLDFRFQLPLLRDANPKDVNIIVKGILSKVAAKKFVLGQDIENGQLFLDISLDEARLAGMVETQGIPVKIEMAQVFGGPRNVAYNVSATLNDLHQKSVGVPFAQALVGDIAVNVNIQQGATTTFNGRIDLTKAAVEKNMTGWLKPANTPANILFRARLDKNENIFFQNISATGPDLDVAAAGTFSVERQHFSTLNLTRVKLGKTNIVGTLIEDDKTQNLTIEGDYLDIGSFLKFNKPDEEKEGRKLIKFDGHVGQLDFGGEDTLRNVAIKVDYDSQKKRTLLMNLDATTYNKVPVVGSITNVDGMRRFVLYSDDAGGTLRGLDVFDNMVGGKLDIQGVYDEAAEGDFLAGSVRVADFRIVKAPVLAQLINFASLTGALDALSGEGIKFDKMIADFKFYDDIIRIDNMEAVGDAIGISAEGNVDKRQNMIEMTGTFAPAYAINRFIGRIPLIGDLITGGGAEDFLAARYTVRGDPKDPDVSINPLSALTPGFLRGIFSKKTKPIERPKKGE